MQSRAIIAYSIGDVCERPQTVGRKAQNTTHYFTNKIYEDRGCKVAPSCFICPLPECAYESNDGHGVQRHKTAERDLQIERLFSEGYDYKEIAAMLGVSDNTVFRAQRRINERE